MSVTLAVGVGVMVFGWVVVELLLAEWVLIKVAAGVVVDVSDLVRPRVAVPVAVRVTEELFETVRVRLLVEIDVGDDVREPLWVVLGLSVVVAIGVMGRVTLAVAVPVMVAVAVPLWVSVGVPLRRGPRVDTPLSLKRGRQATARSVRPAMATVLVKGPV